MCLCQSLYRIINNRHVPNVQGHVCSFCLYIIIIMLTTVEKTRTCIVSNCANNCKLFLQPEKSTETSLKYGDCG